MTSGDTDGYQARDGHDTAPATQRAVPWGNVLLTAFSAVGWSYSAMAAVAALGLHLLGADAQGSLGPMTAAVVTMAVGGKVSPSGDVTVFGISGAAARGTIDIIPLGVGLVGALLLAWVVLRSLRQARGPVGAPEVAARTGTVAALFFLVLGGLAWAGHSTISINGAVLGNGNGGTGGILGTLPGIGDLGNLGGGLLNGLGHLVKDKTSVGFRADIGASMTGGLIWVLAVLAIALLASRAVPLPPGWAAVRPAVWAVCVMLLAAVVAGLATAVYSAITDGHPGRVVGSALLGAPNGVWLGATLGLFVPWYGNASGPLSVLLPHPLEVVLGTGGGERSITVARLAQVDGRMWLLPVAAAVMMLAAGVLTASRTPSVDGSRWRYVGGCAGRLALVGAGAVPLVAWLTAFNVNADLSVFGFDAVGSALTLHPSLALAALLGAAWGAVAGAAGALALRWVRR
ncbi:streptophobe family protein [Streptomyces silvisoli]|uniref:Streptophobe family protein n=1 Tax=Streptomyces silvisoli TaxID=3034235 RepID=A0ABT5ZX60_9ACTN|nr:streptophobe family protein [Streptomyces silvisoli]MDF3293588.1 streptophobe family protein [Streptomyces silvisoli]